MTDEVFKKWKPLKVLGSGGQGKVHLVEDSVATFVRDKFWENLLSAAVDKDSTDLSLESAIRGIESKILQISKGLHSSKGALKVLLPLEEGRAEDQATAAERMKQELSVLRSISHPSLVKVLDSDFSQRWFVMEYHEKGTLSEHAGEYKGDVFKSLKAFRDIVDAVSKLHSNKIVHRDIKPDNIFVANDGRLVLGDCGLAFKLQNQERLLTLPK